MLETAERVEGSRATRSYELVPLGSSENARWDELIAKYPERTLFHQRVWHHYLAETRGIEPRYWAIVQGSRVVGHFCAGIIRKGPFRILGSPLKGWGTNFMGPLASDGFDVRSFLSALDRVVHQEKLAMVELESAILPSECLAAEQYRPVGGSTYIVPLHPENPEDAWSSLDSTCRNRIRKAIKNGLRVECTRDQTIADEFYDQLLPIMLRQGISPPYPREHAHQLVQHLMGEDLLIALRVTDTGGQTIATGLFPYDRRTMYFWGGASVLEARKQCPNEIMHWTAMRLAAAKGVREYNMCGPGAFKRKFGGSLMPTTRWHKSYNPYAEPARRLYQTYFQARMRLQAWFFRGPSLHFSRTDRFRSRQGPHE